MSPSEPARGFSLQEIARLLRLSPRRVRTLVRAGILEPRTDERASSHFTFEELVRLRNARGLMTRTWPRRRLRRAFGRLRQQLGDDRLLPSVRLAAEGRNIVARRGDEAWEPESGQRLLCFDPPGETSAETVTFRSPSPQRYDPEPALEKAREIESSNPEGALEAYATVLDLYPDHSEARLDLGRLLHEMGDPEGAEEHFRRAMESNPDDAIAPYNLGVTLQDLERHEEAIDAYRDAIRIDPGCADAHYNLASIFHGQGNELGAMKHLKIYRRLTDS